MCNFKFKIIYVYFYDVVFNIIKNGIYVVIFVVKSLESEK